MLYDIRLQVSYEYDQLANAGRQTVRLIPADIPGVQRLITSYLDIQPMPTEQFMRVDFFGNKVMEIAYNSSHARIDIGLNARVERFAQIPGLDMSPPVTRLMEEIADYKLLDADSPHHFIGPSPRIRPHPDVTAFGRDLIKPHMTTLGIVETIGFALHKEIRFDADATTVDTPFEEAFAHRHGVCQDFAHIMISCLRGLGVPAGYVSGYLRTNPPEGQPRLEGADAMHAWVRAWCGLDVGWVEFDPTNALVVAGDHIVVARGRDYSDVSPVKGVLRTAGDQTSEHSVDVVLLDRE